MQITHDIREDLPRFRAYLIDQVEKHINSTTEDALVGIVHFGFACEQSQWVALVFDTRENPEPDGVWGGMVDESEVLECTQWQDWEELSEEDSLVLIDIEGNAFSVRDQYTDWELVSKIIGEALKASLLSARDEGLLNSLQKAENCQLGVEELEGRYGWPLYEDRGKENLVK